MPNRITSTLKDILYVTIAIGILLGILTVGLQVAYVNGRADRWNNYCLRLEQSIAYAYSQGIVPMKLEEEHNICEQIDACHANRIDTMMPELVDSCIPDYEPPNASLSLVTVS